MKVLYSNVLFPIPGASAAATGAHVPTMPSEHLKVEMHEQTGPEPEMDGFQCVQPFSVVQDKSFINQINDNPNYAIPGRRYVSHVGLPQLFTHGTCYKLILLQQLVLQQIFGHLKEAWCQC